MARCAVLLMALLWAAPALAQDPAAPLKLQPAPSEPDLKLGRGSFALPIIDYQAPDGTFRRGQGIIVGRDVSPNATVGIGFFKTKPKYSDGVTAPVAGKSKKLAVGLSLRF
jgi:hypothetical protein